MKIGVIKEVKPQENRVGITPKGTSKLVRQGHQILIQKNAGKGSGFEDKEYKKAGAKIISDPVSIAKKCDILVKVKEPVSKEFKVLKAMKGKTLFTYLHLAAAPPALTKELLRNKITGIAYETVEKNGELPLLKPMSQVAGVLAVQYGAQYLQLKYGGKGITMGSVDNSTLATTAVIGAGNVGQHAARTALGLGGKVILMNRSLGKLREAKKELRKEFSMKEMKRISFKQSNEANLTKAVKEADLIVGAVLVRGAKAPIVITKKMVDTMKKGTVIIDVAIDQGGCIWGSKPTSHTKPTYNYKGKIYCNITNMPGQAARQATEALTNATLPYLEKMGKLGVADAIKKDHGLAKGINTYYGSVTYKAVAEALGMSCQEIL